jgi:hypothetical protein
MALRFSPPYISSTPSVAHFSVQKGDILVFACDGMRPSLKDQGVLDESVKKIVVSLAGMDGEASSSCEKDIGPSFMPSTDIQM